MYPVKQSSTSRPLLFEMYLSGGVTPATGKTVTVTLSKNGASFASPSGSVTEVGNGSYQVAGNATDNNTTGILKLYATASGCDPTTETYEVVTYDPTSDVTAVKAKTDQLAFTVANQVDVNVLDWKSATAPAMTGDAFARLGAPVGASLSADIATVAGYIDTEVAAIKAKTDQLTFGLTNKLNVNLTALWGQTTISSSDRAPNLT